MRVNRGSLSSGLIGCGLHVRPPLERALARLSTRRHETVK